MDFFANLLNVIVAAIPVLLLIYKFIISPIKNMSNKFTEFSVKIILLEQDIKVIKSEIMVNSGSTIKDKVNMIMQNMAINDTRWKYLDDSSIPQWECDAEGKCVRANISMCELFGLSQDQMDGWGWFESVSSIDRNRVHEQWTYACKYAVPYQAKYGVQNQITGESYDIIAEGFPVSDTHGVLIHWFGTCKKVGSSKKRDHSK